jgi:riboflavin biosynthesis pyrimidine reductase
MVISLDGSFVDDAGSSRGLSSSDDLRVMLALRALSDCILIGANTARSERYVPGAVNEEFAHHVNSGPAVAVVTRTFELPHESALFTGTTRPIIFGTTADADKHEASYEALRDNADVVLADTDIDGTWIRDVLATRGLTRVLCEGGPKVIELLRDGAVLDEIAVTVAPILRGASTQASNPLDSNSLSPGYCAFGRTPTTLRISHTAVAADHTFLRCIVSDNPPTLVT